MADISCRVLDKTLSIKCPRRGRGTVWVRLYLLLRRPSRALGRPISASASTRSTPDIVVIIQPHLIITVIQSVRNVMPVQVDLRQILDISVE